jgi:hypothetical protein
MRPDPPPLWRRGQHRARTRRPKARGRELRGSPRGFRRRGRHRLGRPPAWGRAVPSPGGRTAKQRLTAFTRPRQDGIVAARTRASSTRGSLWPCRVRRRRGTVVEPESPHPWAGPSRATGAPVGSHPPLLTATPAGVSGAMGGSALVPALARIGGPGENGGERGGRHVWLKGDDGATIKGNAAQRGHRTWDRPTPLLRLHSARTGVAR